MLSCCCFADFCVDGIPFGFANAVRRGSIGMIASSGTGAQQVSCLVDKFGLGVSQLIGTGGRDLKEKVGGIMTLLSIDVLEGIIIVSFFLFSLDCHLTFCLSSHYFS